MNFSKQIMKILDYEILNNDDFWVIKRDNKIIKSVNKSLATTELEALNYLLNNELKSLDKALSNINDNINDLKALQFKIKAAKEATELSLKALNSIELFKEGDEVISDLYGKGIILTITEVKHEAFTHTYTIQYSYAGKDAPTFTKFYRFDSNTLKFTNSENIVEKLK